MLDEFKKFALKGNVVDLAVGVIIGAAFSQIVTSLVADVVMPIIGFITGGLDFSNYFFQLTGEPAPTYAAAKAAGATIGYGQFLTVALNFMIVAWILFLAVRGINRLRRAEEAKPPQMADVPREQTLLEEIRDLLAARSAPPPPMV
jgi:large conductance mechanosensitive channel